MFTIIVVKMLRAFQRVVIRVMEHIGTTEFGVAYLPEAKLSGLVNGHR